MITRQGPPLTEEEAAEPQRTRICVITASDNHESLKHWRDSLTLGSCAGRS
jgi:hypothetical protein